MKVSLQWAQYYSNVDLLKLPKQELLDKIGAQLGAIEEVIDISERYKGIVVARVVECIKHPNADKLHICKIDDAKVVKGVKRDENGYVQVVCGAPNVKAGMLAAWLPPGTIVPSTFGAEQLKLEVRDIRGETSNGMLASAHELAISDESGSIVEVQPLDANEGDDFALTYKLNDTIIDIENKMFTHRPDCFGILGVAREIAGITHQQFESPSWYKSPTKLTKEGVSVPLSVKNAIPKAVPRFAAVALHVGHNGPSPLWMQTYLSRVGMRPINAVVDVTNYFMHLTGQPLHAYDYDKLAALGKDSVSLETRFSNKNEKLKLLSGKEVIFSDTETILITSQDIPVGIGGVMGGEDTEVDENTKKIVLECANFDMYTIRRTAMRYGLFTDAVTRFNKGQSSLQQDRVLAHAAKDICRFTQGSIASEVIDKHGPLHNPSAVRISPDFINERLGLNLSPKKITELLENVEFKVMKAAGKQFAITPPFWRTDIHIPEDVVEEVGRLYGYDHLPLILPSRDLTPAQKNTEQSFKAKIRDILSKSGANEVLTYSFVHGDLLKHVGQDAEQAFQLSNAISPDLQYYRLSLTPSLLNLVHSNVKAGHDEFALFEIGKSHKKGVQDEAEPEIPAEETMLAFVFTADDRAAQAAYGGAPYYQALSYMDELMQQLGIPYSVEPLDHEPTQEVNLQLLAPFDKSRSVLVRVNDEPVGFVGEFSEAAQSRLKLPVYSAGFELDIAKLLQSYKEGASYHALPRFPRVEQDMTLKLSSAISYSQIFTLLWESLQEMKPDNTLASLSPLDIYQKEPDTKNVTWRLSLASYERTLTDIEVNKLLDDMAEAAHTQYKAERI